VIETEAIVNIQDFLDRWRMMGSRKLTSGTELIGEMPTEDGEVWMHAIYPKLPLASLDKLQTQLGQSLPRDLRAFYRLTRGLSLFQGAFRVYGKRASSFGFGYEDPLAQPDDLLQLNHEIEALGWKPSHAIAFAVNGWDQSVHLFGMTNKPRQIARCDRSTGKVLELHESIWECLMARLYKLDQLFVRS